MTQEHINELRRDLAHSEELLKRLKQYDMSVLLPLFAVITNEVNQDTSDLIYELFILINDINALT